MALTWLHVSDFHMRSGDAYDREVVLQALVSSVRRMRESDGRLPDLIFSTGDIAHSGEASQYAAATAFFDALLDAAGLERRHLFTIPGNHDVDRNRGVGLARTLTSREESDRYFAPGSAMPHMTLKLDAYHAWYREYFDGIRACPRSSCGPVELVDAGGTKVAVLAINSALFCADDDDHAKLHVGRRPLTAALDELRELEADARIALVHHPLDWLADIERGNVRAALAGAVDVVLRGHLHETDVEQVVSQHGSVVHVAAGAAYQTRKWPNRALYGTLGGGSLELFPIRYEDSPTEIWTVDPSVFPTRADYTGRFEPAAAPTTSAPAAVGQSGPRPSPAGAFRSNIPSRRGVPVVCRDDELRAMAERLQSADGEHVLVLHGAPGVGKSELAREFARRNQARYPGGTFLLDATSASLLVDLARIGTNHLGMTYPDGLGLEDQCEQALAALGAQPTLLLYDNVGSLDAIERWLPPAGMPCHVVITTVREPPAVGWPAQLVSALTPAESVELVEALGGPAVAERYGAELAARTGGLPVELCPAATVLAHAERRGRGADLAPLARETHASFALVYEQLELPERLLLHAAAALNPQRIDRAGLHADLAAGAGEIDAGAALDACIELHLVEGDEELRMHQLFASFLGSVDRDDDLDAALQQVRAAQRDRLVTVASALVEAPGDAEYAAALVRFRLAPADWEDLQERISAADGGQVGKALLEIGEFGRARPWFERAVDAARQGDVHGSVDHESLGSSLHLVGYCHTPIGEFTHALPWFEQAVDAKRQGDIHGRIDHDSLGRSLHQVGWCHFSVGEFTQALPWFEQAVDAKRQGDIHGRIDHESRGLSLHQVGFCHWSVGEFTQALPSLEQAVDAKRQGDIHGRINHNSLSHSLHLVGWCQFSVGEHAQALPWFEQAVEAARQGDIHGRIDHESLGRSMHQVGSCHSRAGAFVQALPWFEQAVDAKRQGDIHGRIDHDSLGRSLHQVAYCHLTMGEFTQGLPWFEQAVDAKRQGDIHGRIDHDSLGGSLHQVGACHFRSGEFAQALPCFEQAVEAARQGDIYGRIDHESIGVSLRSGAACLRELGEHDLAARWEAEAAAVPADDP